MTTNPHFGSSFDDWLKEQGIHEEVAAINRHIDRYFSLLQAQLDASPDDWPTRFTFPKPGDDAERQAFERFLFMVRDRAGLPVEPVEFTA